MSATKLLDQIEIASPCQVPWSSMTGNDRTRFCQHCRKSVYNIAEMTREEAEALIFASGGTLCGRLYKRADGTVLTKDCRNPTSLRRRIIRWMAIPGILVLSLFGWAFLQAKDQSYDRYDSWTRRTEPFRTILEWIDPSPPMVISGVMAPPPYNSPPPPATP
ncbi:MAG: hypothetical protein ACJ8C4_05320 [Gemmataceae bacterium]